MYCNTKKSPELKCCGPHPKPHGARGLSKNYHLRFYPKLGHGICAIRRITCDYIACTSMIYQPWIYGIPSKKKSQYQPVINFNYRPVISSYNNWNIIQLSPKSKPFEAFKDIYQVFLDIIRDNMASLVQHDKYGAIETDDTTTNGYYVINLILEAYKLQNN